MFSNITIGQFFPGDTALHRLDPRTKIILLLVLFGLLFTVDTPLAYAALSLLALALVWLSRLPFHIWFRSLKLLWWLIFFTFLWHILAMPDAAMMQAGVWRPSPEGIRQGGLLSLRLILLVTLSSVLMFTTSPLSLTDAIEKLLAPGQKIGLPAHELAMMMTIALRFVPTIFEETDRIMKAQEARGADLLTGNILKRIKNTMPIIVPLLAASFRRADDLALAMEARCYRGAEGRTHMKELRLARLDYAAIGIVAVIVAVILSVS